MSEAQTGLGFTLAHEEREDRRPLRRSTDGAPIAFVEASDPPVVFPLDGEPWRVEPFGRGWRLTAQEIESGDVLCWYTPRAVRSGGELLLADERAYAVRSALRKRLDLHVLEGGERLLDVRAVPVKGDDCRIEIARHRPPRHAQDEVLIVSFLAVLALLVFHQGRAGRHTGWEGFPVGGA